MSFQTTITRSVQYRSCYDWCIFLIFFNPLLRSVCTSDTSFSLALYVHCPCNTNYVHSFVSRRPFHKHNSVASIINSLHCYYIISMSSSDSDDTSSLNSDEKPIMSFLVSNKNKRLLVIDGFIYQQNKITSKVSYWICEEKLCKAGVHLSSNDVFMKYTENLHTHLPIPERLEIRKMMTNVKTRVNREATAIGQIYNDELATANLSRSALAIAPTAREASKCKTYL
jgi:hypothetical protein